MQYPSFAEYSEALQSSLETALSDPLLRRGQLRMHGPGQPVTHSGSFALTFEVSVDGRTYAVRCFHKYSDALQERYRAISHHLHSSGSHYFVNFEFQPAGITTESGTYPIVRMDWAEGQTLGAFVAQHRYEPVVLQQLRVSLRGLAAHLQRFGIAHGDIQPPNIIVRSATELRLIDYDGMFVPQLARLRSAELGQRNFQHPGRRPRHFDATLDAFSFSLTDLALDALCRRPELWHQSDSDADAFILRAADLADPAGSPVFRLLASVPGLEQRVRNFAAVCVSPFERIPDFEDFVAARNIPAVSVVFSGDATLALRRKYVSVYDIVDATNFARCCSHVGDCVELIGQIVRVVRSRAPQPDGPGVRIEFAESSHDTVCLKIWPDALSALDTVPDETWVGQWVSAVGLVDPVYVAWNGMERQKDVSITITEQSQLHRLTEAEARYRLLGYRGSTRAALDTTAAVKTDRVLTEPMRPLLALPPPAVRRAEPAFARLKPPEPERTTPQSSEALPPQPAAPQGDVPLSPSRQSAVRQAPAPPSAVSPAATRPVPPPSPVIKPLATVTPRGASQRAMRPGPPVLPTTATMSRPPLSRANAAQGRVGDHEATRISRRWQWWTATAVVGSLMIYAFMSLRDTYVQAARDSGASARVAAAAPQSALAPTESSRPPADRTASQPKSQQPLGPGVLPLETVAGRLDVRPVGNSRKERDLRLNGEPVPGLSDDAIMLEHRTVFADREIIVGFTRCDGTLPPCGLKQPFWLELRAGLAPKVWRVQGLWASTGGGSVAATGSGASIDLGVWNGESRVAALSEAGRVEISRSPAPRRALDRAGCAAVVQSAEACAASRDCRSFESSAARIPSSRRARLTRLYHESTGFDAVAFRGLCIQSCRLGLTPSYGFIRRNVCSGARADQWPADDPAAGFIG